MKTCVIFCAGGFEKLAEPIGAKDYVLAADGGLVHLETLGIKPHGIIGDFDSLGYVPAGAQVFPVEKDDTDSMLAVRKGLELGYGRSCSTERWTARGWTTPLPICRPSAFWQSMEQPAIWWVLIILQQPFKMRRFASRKRQRAFCPCSALARMPV